MDLTDTIQPNSEQLDAVDLLSGPRTFTIERVSKGNAEQPVNYYLSGFPRPWRPGKSMRRVLVGVWGADASKHVGRSLTLFCDQSVSFGGQKVGGTRISHMSHLDKPKQVPLLVTRGKSQMYTVQPLTDLPPTELLTEPTPQQVASSTSADELRAWLPVSRPVVQSRIEQRIAELDAEQGPLIPNHSDEH